MVTTAVDEEELKRLWYEIGNWSRITAIDSEMASTLDKGRYGLEQLADELVSESGGVHVYSKAHHGKLKEPASREYLWRFRVLLNADDGVPQPFLCDLKGAHGNPVVSVIASLGHLYAGIKKYKSMPFKHDVKDLNEKMSYLAVGLMIYPPAGFLVQQGNAFKKHMEGESGLQACMEWLQKQAENHDSKHKWQIVGQQSQLQLLCGWPIDLAADHVGRDEVFDDFRSRLSTTLEFFKKLRDDSKQRDVFERYMEPLKDAEKQTPAEKSDDVSDSDTRGEEKYVKIVEELRHFKNLVLEGVPGTGKTYAVRKLVEAWENEKAGGQKLLGNGRGEYAMTFHPSTSYEDFVEGLRPQTSRMGEEERSSAKAEWFFESPPPPVSGGWGVEDGAFVQICSQAARHPGHDFLVLVDELNRANVPKVLGDLMTTLEKSKRARWVRDAGSGADRVRPAEVKDEFKGAWEVGENTQTVLLPYSKRKFFVPENVYLLATLNTTDRSVAPLDAALRRRFAFHRLEPVEPETPKNLGGEEKALWVKSVTLWKEINGLLRDKIGPDAVLGHSYFYDPNTSAKGDDWKREIIWLWKQQLLPQLIDGVMSANCPELFEEGGELKELLDSASVWLQLTVVNKGVGLYKLPTISEESPAKSPSDESTGGDDDSSED